jgi:hypothetical protein
VKASAFTVAASSTGGNVAAEIASVGATNGTISIVLVADPTVAPTSANFQPVIKAYIGTDTTGSPVTPTWVSYTAGTQTVAYTFTPIAQTTADQSVIIGAKLGVATEVKAVTSFTVVGDNTAPSVTFSLVDMLTATTGKLHFTSDEAGTYYYVVLAAGDGDPNAAAIKAQGTAVTKGTGTAIAAANTVDLTGLTGGTAYKAYVIVEDAVLNASGVENFAFSTNTGTNITLPADTSITIVPSSNNKTFTITGAYTNIEWYVNGKKMAGATDKVLTLTGARPGSYEVRVVATLAARSRAVPRRFR